MNPSPPSRACLTRSLTVRASIMHYMRNRFLWTWLAIACLALLTGFALDRWPHTRPRPISSRLTTSPSSPTQTATQADSNCHRCQGAERSDGRLPARRAGHPWRSWFQWTRTATPGQPSSEPGPAGPAGQDGEAGQAGSPGTPGTAGPTGPTGAFGAIGPVGPTGATGPAGERGAAGVKGDAGESW